MKLEPRIHDNRNDLDYVLTDHYYLPALRLPEDKRPIGRWGRLHREYLKTYRPLLYNELLLSGRLHAILADLDEQAAERYRLIVQQMAQAEGITEELKACDPVHWIQAMNSIRSRAEEIIQAELIYCWRSAEKTIWGSIEITNSGSTEKAITPNLSNPLY